MRILALDPGKYKTVACEYEAEIRQAPLCDGVDHAQSSPRSAGGPRPQRVVIKICSIAGWVSDLVRSLIESIG